MPQDLKYMKAAMKQAQKALSIREVPIGAVIVKDDRIIARGYNRKEIMMSTTKHAELIAIEKACGKLGNWRLEDCTLYVTLEPCMMCMGAILESRIRRVVYGAENFRLGFLKYLQENNEFAVRFLQVTRGVMAEESAQILKEFFKAERWLSSVESARLEIE